VGKWEDDALPAATADVNTATGGVIARLAASRDITGKAGELVPILAPTGITATRLLVVGLGWKADATRAALHDIASAAARFVTSRKFGTIALALPEGTPADTLAIGVGLSQGCYGPGWRRSQPGRAAPTQLLLVAPGGSDPRAALNRARAEAKALWLARELVNAPPNELYPETFAAVAAETGRECGLGVEVWDESRLAEEKMTSLLAVAGGSAKPPRLVVLRYAGNPGGPTLALVGKGVTFDSGGLSLKPTDGMVDMKCDMAGAAAVLGGIKAVADLKLRVNILGVLALVENRPGGRAMKLGDVMKARNGTTIEVLNTDAEGRLILADALCYAAEQKPAHMIDFATLTGACLVALGPHVAGLMTNNDAWGTRVLSAVNRAGERAWQLPMDSHYDEMIRSKVADIRNTGGGRWGGAITAAKFLEQFVGRVPWAHLDIAGPAWLDSENASLDSGGTGSMVRAIVELASGYGA
ncbi:MAG TPA: leucyl aminopeptidase, partial [Gemmataceae bacterium]|nr:leucyl aminopeptidase [Gemmataceae bacterium]